MYGIDYQAVVTMAYITINGYLLLGWSIFVLLFRGEEFLLLMETAVEKKGAVRLDGSIVGQDTYAGSGISGSPDWSAEGRHGGVGGLWMSGAASVAIGMASGSVSTIQHCACQRRQCNQIRSTIIFNRQQEYRDAQAKNLS